MTRLFAATLTLALLSPAAFAQDDMSRPTGSSDTPEPTRTADGEDTTIGQRTPDNEGIAGTAEDLGLDTSGCQEYLVPTHRNIVELRYIAEAMPAGPLKRELAGRLDKMEGDTASALGSVCGVRNLDRTPPSTFDNLDVTAIAGAAGTVFGNDIEVNEDGFIVKLAEVAGDLIGVDTRSRRERRRDARSSDMARGGTSADDAAMTSLVEQIRAAPFADDKIAALERGAAGKTFTSAQVAEIVGVMPFAEQRIPVAIMLYGQTSDPANFEAEVSGALPFASERAQLREAMAEL